MNRTDDIIVQYIYPPIPLRAYDWQATRASYDLGGVVGFGATPTAAVQNLLEGEALLWE